MDKVGIKKQLETLIINQPRFNGQNIRRDECSADMLPGEISPFYQGAVLVQYLRNKHNAVVSLRYYEDLIAF